MAHSDMFGLRLSGHTDGICLAPAFVEHSRSSQMPTDKDSNVQDAPIRIKCHQARP